MKKRPCTRSCPIQIIKNLHVQYKEFSNWKWRSQLKRKPLKSLASRDRSPRQAVLAHHVPRWNAKTNSNKGPLTVPHLSNAPPTPVNGSWLMVIPASWVGFLAMGTTIFSPCKSLLMDWCKIHGMCTGGGQSPKIYNPKQWQHLATPEVDALNVSAFLFGWPCI